ncbi:MAG TPA: mechanosensitive ion channel domain-containing protein [Longimicrobiales bacterium]|nr:mechanosensitive ion channel domain-containing protein [Longimicrobiales bacterium]
MPERHETQVGGSGRRRTQPTHRPAGARASGTRTNGRVDPHRRPAGPRPPRRQDYGLAARQRLRRFRQGSLLAVAFTGLFLLVWGVADEAPAQEASPAVAADTVVPADTLPPDPARAVEEAAGTVRDIGREITTLLPKILFALALLALAAVLVRIVRLILRRALRHWQRADAATAMAGVGIWLLAVGIALTVVAGDARALVGSVGLLGLALSWALQAPIESFAGWLLNSFKSYYRVGDRIAVGDVFGDVYRIDVLNTTVWEAGGPGKSVQGAQPTGALITFPNSEVLRTSVVNYTRDYPYMWDEVTVGVTNESDLAYAMDLVAGVAGRIVGPAMAGPAARYRELLQREGLAFDIAEEPQVFLAQTDSWVDVTVRYLVPARERRRWSTALIRELSQEMARPENRERVTDAYPVTRLELPPGFEPPSR